MIVPNKYDIDNKFKDVLEKIHQHAKIINNNDITYEPKIRNGNTFKRVPKELRNLVEKVLYSLPDADSLEWEFEIFCSRNPVTLHNDRNYYDHLDKQCQRGFILPLEWNGKTPSTLMYDKYYPEKLVLNYDHKEENSIFKKLVGREQIDDPNINFKVNDCNLTEEYIWKKGTCLIFDSSQIHSSSNFILDNNSYKLSVNALGYTVGKSEI